MGLYVYVEDVDSHYRRAKAAGAEIVRDLKDTDYGSREYAARDLEGHLWSFGTYRPQAPATPAPGKVPQDDFVSLFAFNRWANGKMLAACRKLTAEQYAAEPVPGWSSVRSTVVHIAIVTEGWLRGLAADRDESVATEAELPAVDDAERLLEKAYRMLDVLLPALTPDRLAQPVTLRRRGRTATLPPWVLLRHLVNHTTYHRGQVASKLKRFGVQQPETDLVYWLFEQMPQQA
jgi:uncharacterized damage-inducible protein DinB